MKRIKTILTLSFVFITLFTNAQIKVHSDNHISLGSLNKDYGIQIMPTGYVSFRIRTSYDWGLITLANTINTTSKCWVVSNDTLTPQHRFFVTGQGFVYRVGELSISDQSLQNRLGNIGNDSNAVYQMTGFYYTFNNEQNSKVNNGKRYVGLSAQEIEQFIPEAVDRDDKGYLYVNYEVLTVFLIETVKKQHQEIQELQKIVEKNGLMK